MNGFQLLELISARMWNGQALRSQRRRRKLQLLWRKRPSRRRKVRSDLLASGEAFVYNEPEGLVMSRSGDECIVALCDQWYLNYGEPAWKEITERLV